MRLSHCTNLCMHWCLCGQCHFWTCADVQESMDETLDNMRDSAYFPVAGSGKNEDRTRHQCGRFTRGSAEGFFASQRSCHRGKNALSIANNHAKTYVQ